MSAGTRGDLELGVEEENEAPQCSLRYDISWHVCPVQGEMDEKKPIRRRAEDVRRGCVRRSMREG